MRALHRQWQSNGGEFRMSYESFQKAWTDAVKAWQMGEITYEQLMEFGTLDEYLDYIKEEFSNE